MQIECGVQSAQGKNQPASLFGTDGENGVFRAIVNIMLFIVGAVAVIMLIVGGLRYVISSGDQNQVTAAKNTILYAIVGIVVAVLAFAVVSFPAMLSATRSPGSLRYSIKNLISSFGNGAPCIGKPSRWASLRYSRWSAQLWPYWRTLRGIRPAVGFPKLPGFIVYAPSAKDAERFSPPALISFS